VDPTPKYQAKGFLARSLALYSAARLGTRMTALGGDDDGPLRKVDSISAIRRAPAVTPFIEDRDINAS
jgi:hypothetical protein